MTDGCSAPPLLFILSSISTDGRDLLTDREGLPSGIKPLGTPFWALGCVTWVIVKICQLDSGD